MFRSRCGVAAFTLTLCSCASILTLANTVDAQEGEAKLALTPNVVVQDEGSLTNKASYLIGFNMMKNLNRQKADEINMEQLLKGMQEAKEGVDMKSYIAGYQMMMDFENKGLNLSLENIFEGMTTASSGKEIGMTEEEIKALMTSFQKVVEQRQIDKMKKLSDDNIAATEAYMAKSAADNPNVKKLDNGVQYEILTEGTGKKPTAENKVKIDYHGTFLDGSVFDSLIKPPSGQPPMPAELGVSQFVPGFSEVLKNMKVGGKWRVVIPGQLAYGARGGANGMIGPNQALVFEITLLEILQ